MIATRLLARSRLPAMAAMQQTRSYASARAAAAAAAAEARTKKGGEGGALGGDQRNQLLKRILFETPAKPNPPIDADDPRNLVIERAWAQEQQAAESRRARALEVQYQRIAEAHEELRQLSKHLYDGANHHEHGIVFPRQMRAPTDTPPTTGWNYDFKAPTPKSS